MEPSEKTGTTDSGATAVAGRCSVCASESISVFWEALDVPVHCNVLCAAREEARQVPRGDIRLAFCGGCGLIRNLAFEPERMQYGASYENSLHFSPRFRAYADGLAARLVDRYTLRGKVVLEIACGRGDFLRILCELGDNHGIGFDPSCAPAASGDRIILVPDVYCERYADRYADFICCRHALEHIADPVAFLRMIRRNIGDRTETAVFFEVPNAMFTLRELGVWDLIYEHCTYFVPGSLSRCFALAGFDVLGVSEEFAGQFLSIEARPGEGNGDAVQVRDEDRERLAHDVRAFAAGYRSKVDQWRSRLDDMRRAGRRAVVWGAGSKGVTFLNILGPNDQIAYVVDINPRKHGMYVAGTGQEIIAPETLRDYRPDAVIVMNPIYMAEVRATMSDMNLSAELLTA